MIVDKNKDYSIGTYLFRNFVSLSLEEKEMVLSWRNHDKIRCWMNNQKVILLENHLKYIESLKVRDDVYYWLVYKEGKPIGVVDILNADHDNDLAETGYYLNPDLLEAGLGFEFYYYFKLFFHDYLMINHTIGELLVGNANSYMLITYFGGHAVKVSRQDDNTFLTMATSKSDFDAIKEGSNDLLRFARFIRRNKPNWDKIIDNIKQ
jgi:UDP-4-amino-4,6-dideoxy-N-acetyl-beta-L-altrosamine N-acetyltransferase